MCNTYSSPPLIPTRSPGHAEASLAELFVKATIPPTSVGDGATCLREFSDRVVAEVVALHNSFPRTLEGPGGFGYFCHSKVTSYKEKQSVHSAKG